MYNSTENLILAIAYNLYGSNAKKVQLYIKSRSTKTDVSLWYENLKELKIEAKQHGYSNLIEFCEDVRYLKLVKMYKQKIKMRQKILENQIDPQIYLESIIYKCQNLEEGINFDLQESTNIFEDETDTSNIDPKLRLKEMQESIKKDLSADKIIVETKNDIESKIVKDKEELPKYEKKYYLKMNQNERELDDFLDMIDDKYAILANEASTSNSNVCEVFPAVGKVKNIEERKQLIGKEIKQEKKEKKIDYKKCYGVEIPVKRYKKAVTLEDQYRNILEKIYGKKKKKKRKNTVG